MTEEQREDENSVGMLYTKGITMFEKHAEEYAHTKHCEKCSTGHCEKKCILVEDDCKTFKDGAEFGYNKGKAETALLSQHIIELQKDKGNLTDKVKELEVQIEKMKSDVLSLIKDRMNDDIDQNIIERLAEKWEIKEK